MTNHPQVSKMRWVGRALAVLFGLGLAWFLAEIGLRLDFDALSPGVQGAIENVRVVPWDDGRIVPLPPFNWDRDYQRVLEPGLKNYRLGVGSEGFHIDSISLWGSRVGLRSREPQWPIDIAVVGDSFSMCFVEWDDCWVEILHRDYGWSVMNLGQTSTGTRAHLQMLKTFGIPLEPKLVVWQWYGNDFNDDYGFGLLRGEYEVLDNPPTLAPKPTFGTLADYSAVYALVRDRLWRASHTDRPSGGQTVNVLGVPMHVGDDYNLYAYDLSRPSNALGYDQTVAALDEADHVIREEMNAQWVIVLIPTKEEVYADLLVETLGADYMNRLTEGRERMLALCAERGWRCLDATDTLQAAAKAGEIVYRARDLHINPRGNELVAQQVGDYLVSEGLLPGK
jgi:hypothetical protein